ncbi:MAG: rod shape determining protein RodA [Clostridia bacterium]|jgi:rod shape determining protein RodA|nr:rod shape-determining protein RodA [Clostridiales bacterium]MDK2984475.1 rod shape determining protein RodA [Clostridia bacterium]
MFKINTRLLKNIDFVFVINVIAILAVGIMILPSASASVTSNPLYFVKKQLIAILIGCIVMVFTASINYRYIRRFVRHLYILNILMLITVLVIGTEINGAKSWIKLGPLALQPSELSKIIMIVCFADFLDKRQGKLKRLRDFIPCFLFFAIPLMLIMLQPDMGSGLVFVAIMLGMMLVGGANLKLLSGLVGGGFIAGVASIWAHFKFGMPLPLKYHQIMRLIAFINPYADGEGGRGAGYHIIQSKVAIGSGGLTGKGLFKGSQVQLNFLPEHHTDFIFSVIGEELGFIGGALLLLLFLSLIYRAVQIALNAKDMFGVLIVIGFSSMIVFHVLVNVGMTIGLMPVVGIPLPFVSYGGSAMLANMTALGLILNINMRRKKIPF